MKVLKLILGKKGDLFFYFSYKNVMYFEKCLNNIFFFLIYKYL